MENCPDTRGLRQCAPEVCASEEYCMENCPDTRGLRQFLNPQRNNVLIRMENCPDTRGLRLFPSLSRYSMAIGSMENCPDTRGLRHLGITIDPGITIVWRIAPTRGDYDRAATF